MTATTDTRKRTREDDCTDSMPLSKRINNLHINNSHYGNDNNAVHFPSNNNHPPNFPTTNERTFVNHHQQHNIPTRSENEILYEREHLNHLAENMNGTNTIHSQHHQSYSNQASSSSTHCYQQQQQHHHHHHQLQEERLHQISNDNHCENLQNGIINGYFPNNTNNLIKEEIVCDYNPELDEQENPFYYGKNKLLFELHIARLRRSHQ